MGEFASVLYSAVDRICPTTDNTLRTLFRRRSVADLTFWLLKPSEITPFTHSTADWVGSGGGEEYNEYFWESNYGLLPPNNVELYNILR